MSQEIDERGIRKAIRALRADGWELDRVYDGDPDVDVRTEKEAIEAVTAVDEAYLHFKRGDETGWIFFVMGEAREEDPLEVACDYTTNLTALDGLGD